ELHLRLADDLVSAEVERPARILSGEAGIGDMLVISARREFEEIDRAQRQFHLDAFRLRRSRLVDRLRLSIGACDDRLEGDVG
ncbi:hypothetical protein NK899_23955, partial [Salmonella enterica subsp. enterica serovar Typhimurium]|uniref:hypothetical protein n=1 Tax=Salmonella enterica TaxID=28901 RepID=UPI0020A2FEC5